MTDHEKEWDATIDAARATLGESEKLLAVSEKAKAETHAWLDSSGLTTEKLAKFFAQLPEEERKKAMEEQEQFARELAHDIDAEIQRHSRKKAVGVVKPPRRRNMV